MKESTAEEMYKDYNLLLKESFKHFLPIIDKKFENCDLKSMEYILSKPLQKIREMVAKVKNEYYNFKFQTGKLKEEDLARFSFYRLMLMYKYNIRNVYSLILCTEKVDKDAYYSDSQSYYKPMLYSFKDNNADEALNKINFKIENNKKFTLNDEFHLAFLPLYETDRTVEDLLYKVSLMVNDLKTIEKENIEYIKVMQLALVEIFIPMEETEKYTDVIIMNSPTLERHIEKRAATRIKQAKEEGIDEGLEEGLKVGREEGRREAEYHIARVMLQEKEPLNKIMKFTGFSEKQIKSIR